MNFFSVVLLIIFLMYIKNYFLIGPRFIFRSIANLFFGLQCIAGLAFEGLVRVFDFLGRPFWKLCKWRSAFKENAKAKHCQGKKRKRFSSFLQNLSGASSLCVRDEVFWTEDLIEETTKRLHDSYTILTLIEHDMSARLNRFSTQSCTSSLRLVLHMLGFGTKTHRMRVSPTLKFRKKLPILIQTGEH